MKRDYELIRKILLILEEDGTPPGGIEGYTTSEIVEHIVLTVEAGLVRQGEPFGITWKGYEFLDSCRPEGRWNLAKQMCQSINDLSFDVLMNCLTDLMKYELGLNSRTGRG